MTSPISQEIRKAFCFQHLLCLWWDLHGKSDHHQKTARWAWDQSEERELAVWLECETQSAASPSTKGYTWRDEKPRILGTGHLLQDRPGRSQLPLCPGRSIVLRWPHLCADMFFLQLCPFHWLGYSPHSLLLWPCPCFIPAYQVRLRNGQLSQSGPHLGWQCLLCSAEVRKPCVLTGWSVCKPNDTPRLCPPTLPGFVCQPAGQVPRGRGGWWIVNEGGSMPVSWY